MKLSAEELGTLNIVPETPTKLRDVPRRIQITDGTLSLVAKGFGKLENVKLPTGVYQARVESTVEPFEQMVFLPPAENVSVTYPVHQREVLPSASPVPGAEGMHEYIRGPLDKALTRPASGSRPCRILVMATQSLPAKKRKIDFTSFRLLSQKGTVQKMTYQAAHSGNEWKIVSSDVNWGGWVLESLGSDFGPQTCIRQPIWCSLGWSTLIFTGVNSTTGMPDMENSSIYLWRAGIPFAPELPLGDADPLAMGVMERQRSTELALHSLIEGRSLLSIEQVNTELLDKKFDNPMLGILGCHLLLQRTTKDENLIRIVLGNLERLVPGHPDIIALKVLARRAGVKGLNKSAPVSWPPMLRRGFLALRDQDWLEPEIIARGSLCDRVRTRILSGGVWARWVGEKDRKEFIPGAVKPATASKTAPAWQKLSNITGLFAPTSRKVLSFAEQSVRGGKKLRADDLQWTGLSRQSATAALDCIKEGFVGKLGTKKTPVGVSPMKASAKGREQTRSKRRLRTRESKARATYPEKKRERAPRGRRSRRKRVGRIGRGAPRRPRRRIRN